MKKLLMPSSLALLLACGGSEEVENPLNGAALDDAEIAAVADALQAVTVETTGDAGPTLRARALTQQTPQAGQHPCPLGGRITHSGNVTVTVGESPPYDWSVYGLVTFHISDPTNNLNDCAVATDVLLDGTLTLTIAGSSTATPAGVGASINGTIGINQRGPTGGLIPRGDCYVFLTVPRGGDRATGSVCGRAVN